MANSCWTGGWEKEAGHAAASVWRSRGARRGCTGVVVQGGPFKAITSRGMLGWGCGAVWRGSRWGGRAVGRGCCGWRANRVVVGAEAGSRAVRVDVREGLVGGGGGRHPRDRDSRHRGSTLFPRFWYLSRARWPPRRAKGDDRCRPHAHWVGSLPTPKKQEPPVRNLVSLAVASLLLLPAVGARAEGPVSGDEVRPGSSGDEARSGPPGGEVSPDRAGAGPSRRWTITFARIARSGRRFHGHFRVVGSCR